MRATPTGKSQRQRGVALIEAMVGFMIFAAGVIGLIGLQASMVKAQTAAKFRADAVALAVELEGVMWADGEDKLPQYSTDGCKGHPPCAEWAAKLAEYLPNASYTLTPVASANRNEQVVVITWEGAGDESHRYESQFALPATLSP